MTHGPQGTQVTIADALVLADLWHVGSSTRDEPLPLKIQTGRFLSTEQGILKQPPPSYLNYEQPLWLSRSSKHDAKLVWAGPDALS